MIKEWLTKVVANKTIVIVGLLITLIGSTTATVASIRRNKIRERKQQEAVAAARLDEERRMAALAATPNPSPLPSPTLSPSIKSKAASTSKPLTSPSAVSPTPVSSAPATIPLSTPTPSPAATTTAANCTTPLSLKTPVDLASVTSILYPGQVRGGDFKPHGGFRFDNSADGSITIQAPYGATLISGSRYIESDTVQYLFDFQVSGCNIQYRFDHLRELSSKLQSAANTLPEPKPDDTRTTSINPPVSVSAGEVLAIKIGAPNNTFVDWGVYNMAQNNGVTSDPSDSLAAYGVCWFDWIGSDGSTVRSLPATGNNTSSEYCR